MLSALFIALLAAVLLLVVIRATVDVDFKKIVSQGSTSLISKTVTESDIAYAEISPAALASGSNTTVTIAFDGDNMTAIAIVSDRDVTWTVNVVPDLTVALKANKPYIWEADGYFTNPLAGKTVATFKFANASGADATIFGVVQYH